MAGGVQMITAALADSLIQAFLVLILITGAYLVSRKDLMSLVSTYQIQSLLLTFLALALYVTEQSPVLLYLAAITLASKVLLLPYAIKKVEEKINIPRDLEFHYVSPIGSIFMTLLLILLVYASFSRILSEFSLSSVFYLGAVFGISLTLMGMMITFSRKKVITKIIGYLSMENGVLLFSLFIAELPFIIEVLILIDLFMIVLLATILSVGIDGTIEQFQERFNVLHAEEVSGKLLRLRVRHTRRRE
jgi:hydrogenase-4 component E